MENDVLPAVLDIDFRLPTLSLTELISWGASGCMVFGGIVPFIPQYVQIKRTDNADGFSTHVCLVLLIASTLRILFWFGHPFELPLLAQSIIMFATMMTLLRLCTNVYALNEISTTKRVFTDFDQRYFWKWSRFVDYCQFMLLFCSICGLLTYFFLNNWYFIESLGFLAVFTEALLGAPQFYKNYKNQSTHGMSVSMVCFWLSGDTFKTGYFFINEAPPQFTLCGALQVCIDVAILIQVFYYRKSTRFKMVIPKASLHDEHIS